MMTTDFHEDMRAQAIAWHIRLRDGDDTTWEAFTLWLEADAAHAVAYDAVEAADKEVAPLLLPNQAPFIVRSSVRPRRWAAWAAAVAASIVAGAVLVPQPGSQRYEIATAPGEQRVVALDATTQIMVNGSTRLTLDRSDLRYASLTVGEALFRVRYDADSPFRVDVGGNRIEHVGTVFNVVHHDNEVRVAVAEGGVVYNPGREAVTLVAGQSLVDPRGPAPIVVARADSATIGGWRTGRLSYVVEPMSRVAADLSRSLGLRIGVAPEIAMRRFSGTIILERAGTTQLSRIARVLQVEMRATESGWTMSPLAGAAPNGQRSSPPPLLT